MLTSVIFQPRIWNRIPKNFASTLYQLHKRHLVYLNGAVILDKELIRGLESSLARQQTDRMDRHRKLVADIFTPLSSRRLESGRSWTGFNMILGSIHTGICLLSGA